MVHQRLSPNRSGLKRYLQDHPHQGGIIINPVRKFIYMKPAKTAGTSILRHVLIPQLGNELLFEKKDKHKFDMFLNNITDNELEEYFIFSVVRNPWDRFVSSAKYLSVTVKDLSDNFDKYSALKKHHDHTLQLCYYTHNKEHCFVDFICRFESLQEDLNLVFDQIGLIRLTIPKTNQSYRKKYFNYFNRKSQKKVEDFYKKDIELYGYAFEIKSNQPFYEKYIRRLRTKKLIKVALNVQKLTKKIY